LAPDGEFNYDGELTDYGWIVSSVGGARIKGNGAEAVTSGAGYVFVSRGLDSCTKSGMDVEMKVDLRSIATEYGALTIYAATQNPLASIKVVRNSSGSGLEVYAFSSIGSANKVFSGDVNKTSAVLRVEINRLTGMQTVYVDNVSVVTLSLMNEIPLNEPINGVSIRAMNGMGVDYVRILSVSGEELPGSMNISMVALWKLDDCERYSKNYDPKHNGSVYVHVQGYCEQIGGCSDLDLTRIVRYNENCYEEAFSYCVFEYYPANAGTLSGYSGDEAKVYSAQTGMDGATVCSAILGVGVGVNKILIPSLSVLWNMVLRTAIYWILLLVAVVVVVLVMRASGEGKK
jgi:hypothetical protein